MARVTVAGQAPDELIVAEASALEAGMTFCIEPMIVPTRIGAICVAAMVIVTDHGAKQVTASPKASRR